MKKITLIVGGALVACAVLGALLVYVAVRGIGARQPTREEKRLLLTVGALEDYGVGDPTASQCEVWTAKWNVDRSLELEYEYDTDRHPQGRRRFYLDSEAEINRSVRDARESYSMSVAAYKVGMALAGGVKVRAWDRSLSAGDQSYVADLLRDDEPVGNIVVVRQGRVLHSLIIIGLYFTKAEDLGSLLAPVLAESRERYGKQP